MLLWPQQYKDKHVLKWEHQKKKKKEEKSQYNSVSLVLRKLSILQITVTEEPAKTHGQRKQHPPEKPHRSLPFSRCSMAQKSHYNLPFIQHNTQGIAQEMKVGQLVLLTTSNSHTNPALFSSSEAPGQAPEGLGLPVHLQACLEYSVPYPPPTNQSNLLPPPPVLTNMLGNNPRYIWLKLPPGFVCVEVREGK